MIVDIPPCSATGPLTPDGLPWPLDECWRTETVVGLATGIRDDAAPERLPILADALEEAGCDDELVLLHWRGCFHHQPDCWVVSFCLEGNPLERLPEVLERRMREHRRELAFEAALQASREPRMEPIQKWTLRLIGVSFGYVRLYSLLKRLFGN